MIHEYIFVWCQMKKDLRNAQKALTLPCERAPVMPSVAANHARSNPFRSERPLLFGCPRQKAVSFKLLCHPSDTPDAVLETETQSDESLQVHSKPPTDPPPPTPQTSDPPYLTELTPNLERNFELLTEVLFALPRELPPVLVSLKPTTKKTLVLDLDDTLVHVLGSSMGDIGESSAFPHAMSTTLQYDPETRLTIHFLLRPYAREMLSALCKFYDIIVRSYTMP